MKIYRFNRTFKYKGQDVSVFEYSKYKNGTYTFYDRNFHKVGAVSGYEKAMTWDEVVEEFQDDALRDWKRRKQNVGK